MSSEYDFCFGCSRAMAPESEPSWDVGDEEAS